MRSTGIEISPPDLRVSVVNFLDAPNKSGHDGSVNPDELTLFEMVHRQSVMAGPGPWYSNPLSLQSPPL